MGTDSICSYEDDYPLLIDLTEARNNTKSFDLYKNDIFYKSYLNVDGADTIISLVDAGSYSIKNFTNIDGCPMRVRGGNRRIIYAKDSLEVSVYFEGNEIEDTIFIINDTARLYYEFNKTYQSKNIVFSTEVNGIESMNSIFFSDLKEGINEVIFNAQDECFSISKKVYLFYQKPTVPVLLDSLKFCENEFPDTVFSLNQSINPQFESSAWNLVYGSGTITNDTSFTILNSFLPGEYWLEYSIYNSINDSILKDTIVLIVDQLPEPSGIITADYVTCNSLDTVAAKPLINGNRGMWTDEKFSELSDIEKNTFNLSPGNNFFFWIVSNGVCNYIDTSSVIINYRETVTDPSIEIEQIPFGNQFLDLDDTLSLCLKESYRVSFSPDIQSKEVFEWISGEGTNISNPSSNPFVRQQNMVISGTGLKQYILKIEVENGINCPINFDTLQIAVIDVPDLSSAIILKEDTVCENSVLNSVSIEGAVGAQKYFWFSNSPLLTFQNSNSNLNNYAVGESLLFDNKIDSSATFTVYAENFCGISDSRISEKVLVQLAPKQFQSYANKNIDIVGNDTICLNINDNEEVIFQIKNQLNTEFYLWDFPVIGVFKSDSITKISGDQIKSISQENTGLIPVSIELRNRCGGYGPVNQKFYFQQPEDFTFEVVLTEGENICPEKDYGLQLNSTFRDSVSIRFSGITDSQKALLPELFLVKGDSLLNVLGPDIEVIDKELCYADFENTTIISFKDVGINEPKLYQPETVCEGGNLRLQEFSQQKDVVAEYVWYKDGELVKQSEDNFIELTEKEQNGKYQVALVSAFACNTNLSNVVEVKILENPELFVPERFRPGNNEGLDVFVKENKSVIAQLPFELSYSGSESLVYDWKTSSINNIISESEALSFIENPNVFNPNLVVNNYQEDEVVYNLNVSTGFGCSATDSVLVNFIKPFIAPTAFTPNGDNINDTWVLDGLTKFPDAVVSIYNRWGTLIFQKYGGYEGHFSGNELPIGTYYWIVDFQDNSREPESGTVTIIR